MIINRKDAEAAYALLGSYYEAPAVSTAKPEFGALLELDVKNLYRIAAAATHPDKGGTREKFVAVDRAKHVLLHWLKRAPDALPPELAGRCTECEGSGYVRMRGASFGQSLRRQCGRCKGTGDTNYEHEKQCGD